MQPRTEGLMTQIWVATHYFFWTSALHYHDGVVKVTKSAFYSNHITATRPIATSSFAECFCKTLKMLGRVTGC